MHERLTWHCTQHGDEASVMLNATTLHLCAQAGTECSPGASACSPKLAAGGETGTVSAIVMIVLRPSSAEEVTNLSEGAAAVRSNDRSVWGRVCVHWQISEKRIRWDECKAAASAAAAATVGAFYFRRIVLRKRGLSRIQSLTVMAVYNVSPGQRPWVVGARLGLHSVRLCRGPAGSAVVGGKQVTGGVARAGVCRCRVSTLGQVLACTLKCALAKLLSTVSPVRPSAACSLGWPGQPSPNPTLCLALVATLLNSDRTRLLLLEPHDMSKPRQAARGWAKSRANMGKGALALAASAARGAQVSCGYQGRLA
jgi:hypothetical protein